MPRKLLSANPPTERCVRLSEASFATAASLRSLSSAVKVGGTKWVVLPGNAFSSTVAVAPSSSRTSEFPDFVAEFGGRYHMRCPTALGVNSELLSPLSPPLAVLNSVRLLFLLRLLLFILLPLLLLLLMLPTSRSACTLFVVLSLSPR